MEVRATPDGSAFISIDERGVQRFTAAASPQLGRRTSPWPPGGCHIATTSSPPRNAESGVCTTTKLDPARFELVGAKGRQTVISRVHLLVALTCLAQQVSWRASLDDRAVMYTPTALR